MVRSKRGRVIHVRRRNYYESKNFAEADKPRLREQNDSAGSGTFLFDRFAADDYETALKLTGGVRSVELARFWLLHHPDKPKRKLAELCGVFLSELKSRNGDGHHYRDVKSRCTLFVKSGFGERYPDTVTRQEILEYVRTLPNSSARKSPTRQVSPRTMRNHKTAICTFFNWLVQETNELQANPAAGIKKRMLPKDTPKEIRFLSCGEVARYLRTLERYDPDLVAHEIVQLFSGVRADDEMADFQAKFVLPDTKEIVIPARIAKTERREVIDGLEESFWAWWTAYAPRNGLVRPKNYLRRWKRIRVLASIDNQQKCDELARLPLDHLLRKASSQAALDTWPWNARRRTFCTYHVAKYQSAAKTALIMRHRGSAYTLHNSYRGLGVTQQQGEAYFQILPEKVASPIRPVMPPRRVIEIQDEGESSPLKSSRQPSPEPQGLPA